MNENPILDCRLFDIFKLQATFEVFSMYFHPLLILLGQISTSWRNKVQQYWKDKLTAIERVDIWLLYWLKPTRLFMFDEGYKRLHDRNLKIENDVQILWAIATCFLYEWPKTAKSFVRWRVMAEANKGIESEIAKTCMNIACGKRNTDLVELACDMFTQEKENVAQVVVQMCAYGYKGIVCYLYQRYSLTLEDFMTRENSALFHSIANDKLEVVQWLLRTFSWDCELVKKILNDAEAPRMFSNTPAGVSHRVKQFVIEHIKQHLKF